MFSQLHTKSVTFSVHDVVPASQRLKTVKPPESLLRLIDRFPGRITESRPLEACCDYSSDCLARIDTHPLIAATQFAYSDHRPLVLSPDILWVTIVQGLTQHVHNNPEEFRDRLVAHSGKQVIEVCGPTLIHGTSENQWSEMISAFSDALRKRLGNEYQRLVSDFSTTGPLELTACHVALMDLYAPYFDYMAVGICGVPTITLEGEWKDWRKLRGKIEVLAEFDLEWWLFSLRPICDQFVRAASGDVDLAFWRNIHKDESCYGATRINGWMVKLIPYIEDPTTSQYSVRNPVLTEVEAMVTTDVLPSGISSVPLTYTELDNNDRRQSPECFEILGGFLGVTQDQTTMALRPKLGWAIRRGPSINRLFCQIAWHEPNPPLSIEEFESVCAEKMLPRWRRLSAELRQFYRWCDGVTLFREKHPIRLLPFRESEVFLNPPLYDPLAPNESPRHRSELEYDPWVKFCVFDDGTFAAARLNATYAREGRGYDWLILHGGHSAEIHGKAPVIAPSFNEFLRMILVSNGARLTFVPQSLADQDRAS